MVAPDIVPHMSQIELFENITVCKQTTDVKLNYQS